MTLCEGLDMDAELEADCDAVSSATSAAGKAVILNSWRNSAIAAVVMARAIHHQSQTSSPVKAHPSTAERPRAE
jgi:hypothetical protein